MFNKHQFFRLILLEVLNQITGFEHLSLEIEHSHITDLLSRNGSNDIGNTIFEGVYFVFFEGKFFDIDLRLGLFLFFYQFRQHVNFLFVGAQQIDYGSFRTFEMSVHVIVDFFDVREVHIDNVI